MIYLLYATLSGWLIMVLINYHSHKRYITRNKDKFSDILDIFYDAKKQFKDNDKFFFTFTTDQIERREFKKYLRYGRIRYIISDTTQIIFSLLVIFVLSYILEYLPFVTYDASSINFGQFINFLFIGYLICLFDAYSKTKKYDMIIKCWKDKNISNCDNI